MSKTLCSTTHIKTIFISFSPIYSKKTTFPLDNSKDSLLLHRLYAQMAELVDALVSNTSGVTSMPVRSRLWVLKRRKLKNSLRFSFLLLVTCWLADRLNQELYCKNWFDMFFDMFFCQIRF